MTAKPGSSAVLEALFALENHIRALPLERRAVAIALAVSRLRRLYPERRPEDDQTASAAQLDLERDLTATEETP